MKRRKIKTRADAPLARVTCWTRSSPNDVFIRRKFTLKDRTRIAFDILRPRTLGPRTLSGRDLRSGGTLSAPGFELLKSTLNYVENYILQYSFKVLDKGGRTAEDEALTRLIPYVITCACMMKWKRCWRNWRLERAPASRLRCYPSFYYLGLERSRRLVLFKWSAASIQESFAWPCWYRANLER